MTLRPELEANNAKPHGLHLNCIYIGCCTVYIIYVCVLAFALISRILPGGG